LAAAANGMLAVPRRAPDERKMPSVKTGAAYEIPDEKHLELKIFGLE
jgi:hypothetical protein